MSNLSITTRGIEYDSKQSLITKVIIQIGDQSYNVTLNDPINESNKYTITKIEATNNQVKVKEEVNKEVKDNNTTISEKEPEIKSISNLIDRFKQYGFKLST